MNHSTGASNARHCADLPAHLPGLDLAGTLQRLDQRADLLRELLLSFAHNQGGAIDRITAHWRAGDTPAAISAAHSLRGLAANLGCTELEIDLRALQVLLRDGNSDPLEIEARLGSARIALEQVRRSVGRIAPVAVDAPASDLADEARITALESALGHREFAARALFDAAAPTLNRAMDADDLAALGDAIRRYDFGTAQALLARRRDSAP